MPSKNAFPVTNCKILMHQFIQTNDCTLLDGHSDMGLFKLIIPEINVDVCMINLTSGAHSQGCTGLQSLVIRQDTTIMVFTV